MLTLVSRCAPAHVLAAGCAAVAPLTATAAEFVVSTPTGAAIQTAIDAAQSGDTVRLAAGTTYVLHAPLDFFTTAGTDNSGVTLVGAGRESTVLAYRGTAGAGQDVIDLEDASGVTLTGFAIDGENRADGAAFGVVAGYGDGGHRLDGLAIRNLAGSTTFGPIGVYFFRDVSNSSVENSTFENIGVDDLFGSGVRVHGDSDDIRVANNTFDRMGRGGVFGKGESFGNPDRLVIRGNTVTNAGLAYLNTDLQGEQNLAGLGIEIQDGVNDAVIEGNTVDRWLSVDNSDGVAVRNNTVTGVAGDAGVETPYGIELVDVERVVVTGNTATGGTNFGLSISGEGDTRHALITDNTFTGADQFGVQIQGDDGGTLDGVTERLYLANNTFTGSGGDAARINRNAHHVVIHDGALDADQGFSVGLAEGSITGIVVTGDTGQRPDHVEQSFEASVDDAEVTASRTIAEFTFSPGEAIELVFGDTALAADLPALEDLDLVLWDLGDGTPSVTDVFGDNGTTAALDAARAADLQPGQVFRAVAWDAEGDSNYVTIRVIPEPTTAALLLTAGGLALLRRRR